MARSDQTQDWCFDTSRRSALCPMDLFALAARAGLLRNTPCQQGGRSRRAVPTYYRRSPGLTPTIWVTPSRKPTGRSCFT